MVNRFIQKEVDILSDTNKWYRGFIQGKTRIIFAWIFAILLCLSARQYPNLPGFLLCFTGATIRFLASGYLHKDSKIAVGGPYAYTRNPLYFGTYLMALGTALAMENRLLTALGSWSLIFSAFWPVGTLLHRLKNITLN